MSLIKVAPGHWIDPEIVGFVTTKTVIFPSDADKDFSIHNRTTAFKSKQGTELLSLIGTAPHLFGPSATSSELQMLNYLHDEAIAAVYERRDAYPYMPVPDLPAT